MQTILSKMAMWTLKRLYKLRNWNLCHFSLDLYIDCLYVCTEITRKYSTAMCYPRLGPGPSSAGGTSPSQSHMRPDGSVISEKRQHSMFFGSCFFHIKGFFNKNLICTWEVTWQSKCQIQHLFDKEKQTSHCRSSRKEVIGALLEGMSIVLKQPGRLLLLG